MTLLLKFSENGHIYNSLEENRIRGNIIILNEEENELKAKKLSSSSSSSEVTVSNEIKGCRAEIKVSWKKYLKLTSQQRTFLLDCQISPSLQVAPGLYEARSDPAKERRGHSSQSSDD